MVGSQRIYIDETTTVLFPEYNIRKQHFRNHEKTKKDYIEQKQILINCRGQASVVLSAKPACRNVHNNQAFVARLDNDTNLQLKPHWF